MIDTKEKLAGLLIPAFALRREGDLGIGDTQAVIEALDFCAKNNASVLQLLPINETGGDNSPYNAISSVALDPVLLTMTPDMVPGLNESILDKLVSAEETARLQAGAVQYPRVKQLKLSILKSAYEDFKKAGTTKDIDEFAAFRKQEQDWLESYCLFRSLIDVNHGNTDWPEWPEQQRTFESAKRLLHEQPQLQQSGQLYAFIQWVAFRQWLQVRRRADALSVKLMGDIPFGVSRLSADVWANQKLFDLEWSGGAPPETFFQGDPFTAKWGQNWGLPLYRWDEHRQEGFAWWRRRVQECTRIFHYFRIDHVLGFFRIYAFPWIPERNGEFVNLDENQAKQRTGGRLPRFIPRSDEKEQDAAANAKEGEALLRMILEAAGGAGVVAEDLGLVPVYVRPLLKKLGIPGFTIPQWERTDNQELVASNKLPELSLATYATHDHLPVATTYQEMVSRWLGENGHAGWLEMQRLMRFLKLDDNEPPRKYSSELHHAFLQALMSSPCWLVVFMITDLLATRDRFNQPGTSGESNWSARLEHPLAWYQNHPPFQQHIAAFADLAKRFDRHLIGSLAGGYNQKGQRG